MHNITDEQVDFILEDIKANGVILEDLQNNLLDHICCIIEHEMPEGEDFYRFYRKILPRFFKNSLKEIQEETEILLTFKNYYAMKRTLKISGLASALLTITGATLKTLHLPGAGVTIVLGGLLFSLVFMPLMIALKFKDEEKQVDKWVFTLGFLLAIGASVGIVFKLMHWPFANILMRSSITAFIFVYVPVYYLTRVRRAELRFNTTVNAVLMMACGGMLYALMNLGYSLKLEESLYSANNFTEASKKDLNSASTELFSEEAASDTLKAMRELSRNMQEKIDAIKNDLIAFSEGIPSKKAAGFNVSQLSDPNNTDVINKHFAVSTGELSRQALEESVSAYNKELKAYFPEKEELQIKLEKLQLEKTNLIVVLNALSQVQLQLANNEYSLLLAAR
ncbi:MAG: hypothetical protein K0R65_2536 [Crocinitomicaceae bacterium]|jgi:hypothetical protein|nr:hypothetical protein [Crocinitomicaceae bacterium]